MFTFYLKNKDQISFKIFWVFSLSTSIQGLRKISLCVTFTVFLLLICVCFQFYKFIVVVLYFVRKIIVLLYLLEYCSHSHTYFINQLMGVLISEFSWALKFLRFYCYWFLNFKNLNKIHCYLFKKIQNLFKSLVI